MTYKVVKSPELDDLESRVSKMLAEGWRPQGGLAISDSNGPQVFYQAMVKEG